MRKTAQIAMNSRFLAPIHSRPLPQPFRGSPLINRTRFKKSSTTMQPDATAQVGSVLEGSLGAPSTLATTLLSVAISGSTTRSSMEYLLGPKRDSSQVDNSHQGNIRGGAAEPM